MKKLFKTFNLLLFTIFLGCQPQQSVEPVLFLIGTWQIEGKASFEEWKQIDVNKISGRSYKIVNDQEEVWETLVIENIDGILTYKAQVPSQNDGKTIPFKLNRSEATILSFENLQHDFPKKIQYKKIDATKIWVNVVGTDQSGFSYYLNKK